ncbi:MAG: hypothetical protein HYW01_02370 [Deltaproteobacteria bacterium]|nr:hypothetical protein [Deltaproteobacteria bacterium]
MRKGLSCRGISFLILIFATSISFISCSDGNEATRKGQTAINGNVVIENSSTERPLEQKSYILALVKGFLALTKSANAQNAEGILVVAFQDGAEVDSDTADDHGNFQLTVPRGGDVTLRFEASAFTANTLITVTPDSEVTLNVSLLPDPPEVQINSFDIVSVLIRTREAEEFVFDEEDANLTIDGGGEDCIRATGSSNVNIDVNDLTLTNCSNGIIGEDFANVSLEAVAVPTLSIDAENNGIHAKDDSSIRLTGIDIFINAGTNGILATGTSGVEVDSSGNCVIQGDDEAVDERDSASVVTGGCTLTR